MKDENSQSCGKFSPDGLKTIKEILGQVSESAFGDFIISENFSKRDIGRIKGLIQQSAESAFADMMTNETFTAQEISTLKNFVKRLC